VILLTHRHTSATGANVPGTSLESGNRRDREQAVIGVEARRDA
jgi:hypothetical protein